MLIRFPGASRLLEQVPAQMGEWAVCWAKLVIPLVVHSASKVRLRAAAALEMGLPLLLQKQMEVAAIVEPLMSTVGNHPLKVHLDLNDKTIHPGFVSLHRN